MIQRLGIFGGSFNPVHLGHCIMAEHFCEQMQLDQCLFVPTYISPFKVNEPVAVDQHHRLKMLHIVCRGNPRFRVDDLEIRRSGVSYTIDTVRELTKRYSNAKLFLLIGTDQAQSFQQWREWKSLLELTTLCVARRPFLDSQTERQMLDDFARHGHPPQVLEAPFIQISSRKIRELRHRDESIRYLVPEKVRRYIGKHKLYQSDEA